MTSTEPAPAQPVAGAAKAERCRCCGHENMSWYAPSPLWNAVMRGGDINGDPIYEDIVCAACFISIASKSGIASDFRVFAKNIHSAVKTRTPEGRIWDDKEWLWVDPTAQDWIKSGGEQGSPSADTIDCRSEGGEKEAECSTVIQRTVADAGGVTQADREAADAISVSLLQCVPPDIDLTHFRLSVADLFSRHRLQSVAAATAASEQIRLAAHKALGEWLAWPDAARDGPAPVDDSKVLSWLGGVAQKLGTIDAKDAEIARIMRVIDVFRRHYELNDCDGRTGNIEIPVSALRAAASLSSAISEAREAGE
ncbi:hypothetical protein [Sphingobium yanoikuyae]|uniref:hypothetical protein n=1 Tax=Sphingobium yanoikuyae TaxID=13690 RepID=UPI000A69973E|nr:hypothetical protein [Sphingobium yanoikuyae]